MQTSTDDALEVLRAAGRSALLVRDDQDVFWYLDLGHLLSEIRDGKKVLAHMAPGQGSIVATEGAFAAQAEISEGDAALFSRIQQIIDAAKVPLVVIPGLSPKSSEFKSTPTTKLPLWIGRRNPSGVRKAELAQTEMGVFTKTVPKPPSADAPCHDFALVATQISGVARQYLIPPRWCTCSNKSHHKFPHTQHRDNERCPRACGGRLRCPKP